MLRHPAFATWFVSGYLLAYTVFLGSGNDLLRMIAEAMLFFAPLLLAWMVYAVIRYGSFSGKELNEEEFGYGDHPEKPSL